MSDFVLVVNLLGLQPSASCVMGDFTISQLERPQRARRIDHCTLNELYEVEMGHCIALHCTALHE